MLRNFFLPGFWAISILFLSSIPSDELPDFSFWNLIGIDKLAHVFMYGIFAFLISRAYAIQSSHAALSFNGAKIAATISIIYGGLIEVWQEYILTYRYGEWLDFLFNVFGTFLGIWIYRKINKNKLVKTTDIKSY